MIGYTLITGALFVGAVVVTRLGMGSLAAALFPIPVAVELARLRAGRALGLVFCAVLAGWIGLHSALAAVCQGLIAAVGLVLGLGVVRGWTYSRTASLAALLMAASVLSGIVPVWTHWKAATDAAWDSWIVVQLEAQEQAGAASEVAARQLDVLKWLKAHWAEMGLGVMMGFGAISACLGLSVTAGILRRRYGIRGLRGSFATARVSEWLVWAVIALAAVWFADERWFGASLRVLTWNTAAALAAVYWLNGLSALSYALSVLRPNVFVYVALVFLLVAANMHPMLAMVGLFDTWGDFRRTADTLAEKKRRMMEGTDDSDKGSPEE